MIIIAKDKEKRIDWNAIRAEYIGGGISQRKLAEKYGVSAGHLMNRANAEGWKEHRDNAESKARAKAEQKAISSAADNAAIAARIKAKGLLLIDRLMDDLNRYTATERRTSDKGVTDIKRLKDLTAAYKDLTDDMPKAEAPNELLQALMDLERGAGS